MPTFIPGDLVAYRSHPNAVAEYGVVSTVGTDFVFVRFAGDQHTKACSPDVLERV